jgi:hypothetical protein
MRWLGGWSEEARKGEEETRHMCYRMNIWECYQLQISIDVQFYNHCFTPVCVP